MAIYMSIFILERDGYGIREMRRSSIIESEKQRRLEIEAALVPVSRGFADEHEL